MDKRWNFSEFARLFLYVKRNAYERNKKFWFLFKTRIYKLNAIKTMGIILYFEIF